MSDDSSGPLTRSYHSRPAKSPCAVELAQNFREKPTVTARSTPSRPKRLHGGWLWVSMQETGRYLRRGSRMAALAGYQRSVLFHGIRSKCRKTDGYGRTDAGDDRRRSSRGIPWPSGCDPAWTTRAGDRVSTRVFADEHLARRAPFPKDLRRRHSPADTTGGANVRCVLRARSGVRRAPPRLRRPHPRCALLLRRNPGNGKGFPQRGSRTVNV